MTMDYTNIPTAACHLDSYLIGEKSNPHLTLPLDGEGKRWGHSQVGIRLHRFQSVRIYLCKETVQKRR